LVEEGYQVRAFARKTARPALLKDLGVEIAVGDLGDPGSVATAIAGMDLVVHAGAGTSGTAEDSNIATIRGTQNVVDACRAAHVKKLVYVSSLSVYETSGCGDNALVTEDARLERQPLRRGPYSAAKLRAEAIVRQAMIPDFCPTAVLRLGTLYGPGAEAHTVMVGVALGNRIFLAFGDRKGELPLLHVDDAVDAIVACMRDGAADNQVFNVLGNEPFTKSMYLERVVKPLYPKAIVIRCPMPLLIAATWMQEKVFALLGKVPLLTVYRLVSSQKRVRYSTSKIEQALGWHSRAGLDVDAGSRRPRDSERPSITERGDW
jgi:nucleoside-diphosphate-sugar epimerase